MPSHLIEVILGTSDAGITGDEFLSKLPHKDEIINHGNGITQKFCDGNEYWFKSGKRHRDGDLPALVYVDGTQAWFKDGKHHRDGDLPSVVMVDGTRKWYQYGLLHRDNGKPAVIYSDGIEEYWVNGKRIG